MELQNIRRLAVFKLRNIGDVLMMTPVLRALRETFPDAKISAVVNSGTEAMLSNNPHIDEVLVYQRGKGQGIFGRLGNEIRFLRELRQRQFDLTISFTEGDRGAWYSWFCNARYRFGMVKRRTDKYRAYNYPLYGVKGIMHEVERHFRSLQSVDFPLRDTTPGPLCLVVPDYLRKWARAEFTPLRPLRIVHVHPVSRWLWKCWSNESMARVIDWLQTERHVRVVVTTGPEPREMERAHEIVRLCHTRPIFYEGNLTLEQIAALSAESDGFFGVDTAPMHMAAAVGVPVIALFGPTNLRNWGPWTPRGQVLMRYCICNVPPAGEKCDWSKVRACMASITVQEAQAALDQMLLLPKTDEPTPP